MRYRRPSKVRRIAKWVGLGVCVAMLAAWASSTRFHLTYWQSDPSFRVRAFHGRIEFTLSKYSTSWPGSPGLSWGRVPFYGGFVRPDWAGGMRNYLRLPFWLLAIAALIPTSILRHRDRRPPEGHCHRCGYNLKGNESGVCPECATPIARNEPR